MNGEKIYAVKGRFSVITAKGSQSRENIIGYAKGKCEDILEFYRNERYSELTLEPIEIIDVRGNSRIESILENNRKKEVKAA